MRCEISTTITEQTRDKKINSNLNDKISIGGSPTEQMDCEDDWIDDSVDDIVVHKESFRWTLQREELPES